MNGCCSSISTGPSVKKTIPLDPYGFQHPRADYGVNVTRTVVQDGPLILVTQGTRITGSYQSLGHNRGWVSKRVIPHIERILAMQEVRRIIGMGI